MIKPISLNRAVDKITVSELYELHQLNKFTNVNLSDAQLDILKQKRLVKRMKNNHPVLPLFLHKISNEDTQFRNFYKVLKGKDVLEQLLLYIEDCLEKQGSLNSEADTDFNLWEYQFSIEYLSPQSDKELEEILKGYEL